MNLKLILTVNMSCFLVKADFIYSGNVNEDLNFEYVELFLMAVEHYCETSSGTLVDLIHTIARWNYSTICSILTWFQTSKIVGCNLESQTDLPFHFQSGACTTFNEPDLKILLCFAWNNERECHMWVYLRVIWRNE